MNNEREVIIEIESAVLHEITLNKIKYSESKFKGEAYGILCALWGTAIWQNQTAPYCTRKYLQMVLGWSKERVIGGRKLLKELGIIEDIKVREGSKYRYYTKICRTKPVSAPPNSEPPKPAPLSTHIKNKVHSRQKFAEGEVEVKEGLLDDIKVSPYVALARELHRIIFTRWKTVVKVNHSNWANELRLLNTKDNIPLDLIKETMVWLEANIHNKYTPHVLSAASFREKFGRLQANIIAEKADEVLPTELDKKILECLHEFCQPPRVEDSYLLEQIAISNRNYLPFWKDLPTFIASFERKSTNKSALEMLLDEKFHKKYIQDWYEWVGREVNQWNDWSGNLKSYEWSLDNTKVAREMNKRLGVYCGYMIWDDLVSAYKEWKSTA
jgi:hypothetical protein